MTHKIIHILPIKHNRLRTQLIFCFCLLLVPSMLQAQQETMYSQYMNSMLNINPAYAGNRVEDNVTALYRKQWVNIEGAPTTGSLSWDHRGDESVVGYGLQIYTDKIGIETSTGVQAFYSYRLPFYKSALTLGLSAGIMNYRAAYFSGTNPETTGGIDPSFKEDLNSMLPTAGIGALFETENWYIGLSAPALLKTKVSDNNYQVTSAANNHYFLTGGYIFDVSPAFKFKPSVMLKAVKGVSMQYDINMNGWINNTIGLGVSYRSNDALVGLFEVQVTPQIMLGYAYDYLTSNLKTYSTGSHELMLRFTFNQPKTYHIQSLRYY